MNLRVLPQAEEEGMQAAHYYQGRRLGLGDEFIDALAAAYREIESNPSRHPTLADGLDRAFRVYTLGRFPYAIVYEIRPDEILVAAVAHHHREPNYWRDRLE